MMSFDYESSKSEYYFKGFLFFCVPGFSIGCLISGFYEFGLGGVLFSAFSYLISKVFWDKVIKERENRNILINLILANISSFLASSGIWIMYLPVFCYMFYFCFNDLYSKVVKDEST
jgi:hypothetical protein